MNWVYEGKHVKKRKKLPYIFADPNMSENDIKLRSESIQKLEHIMDGIGEIKVEYDFINEKIRDLSVCQKTYSRNNAFKIS